MDANSSVTLSQTVGGDPYSSSVMSYDEAVGFVAETFRLFNHPERGRPFIIYAADRNHVDYGVYNPVEPYIIYTLRWEVPFEGDFPFPLIVQWAMEHPELCDPHAYLFLANL